MPVGCDSLFPYNHFGVGFIWLKIGPLQKREHYNNILYIQRSNRRDCRLYINIQRAYVHIFFLFSPLIYYVRWYFTLRFLFFLSNMSMTYHVEKTCILYFQICIFHVFQVALICQPLERLLCGFPRVCVCERERGREREKKEESEIYVGLHSLHRLHNTISHCKLFLPS